jgi:hypothetical protein
MELLLGVCIGFIAGAVVTLVLVSAANS